MLLAILHPTSNGIEVRISVNKYNIIYVTAIDTYQGLNAIVDCRRFPDGYNAAIKWAFQIRG